MEEITVIKCSACGKMHASLPCEPIPDDEEHADDRAKGYTHVTTCPTTGTEIQIKTI